MSAYLQRLSRGRGGLKSRPPRGVAGHRPRFGYRWTHELDVRAAVKSGERKAARR